MWWPRGATAAAGSPSLVRKGLAILANFTLLLWIFSGMQQNVILHTSTALKDRKPYDRSAPLRATGNLSVQAQQLKKAADTRLREIFRPAMSDDEKTVLLNSLRELVSRLESERVPYFLYGGSLLGSYRHHGMIPWDDDIDVMVNFSQTRAVEQALAGVPGYELHSRDPVRYRFYPRTGSVIKNRQWRWPFVDICFFGDNGTHIYDIDPAYRNSFVYRKKDVFPTINRPFEGSLLAAPRNAKKVISANYDVSICETTGWSHRREIAVHSEQRQTVYCSRLFSVYPFVFRDDALSLRRETLRLGGDIVGKYTL